jgi:hypothetical protein
VPTGSLSVSETNLFVVTEEIMLKRVLICAATLIAGLSTLNAQTLTIHVTKATRLYTPLQLAQARTCSGPGSQRFPYGQRLCFCGERVWKTCTDDGTASGLGPPKHATPAAEGTSLHSDSRFIAGDQLGRLHWLQVVDSPLTHDTGRYHA